MVVGGSEVCQWRHKDINGSADILRDPGEVGRVTRPLRLLDRVDQVVGPLLSERFGLVTDFDGTLSELAPTPNEATISPRAVKPLSALAGRLALVAVVSGRAVIDVERRVGIDGVTYVGNHGVELLNDGGVEVAPGAELYEAAIHRVVDQVNVSGLAPEIYWEDKRYSVSAHFRHAADPGSTRRRLEEALTTADAAQELDLFWGNMVLEIRAPLKLDKGYAVRRLVEGNGLNAVLAAGDDRTDVDAWRALREMRGVRGVSVVVEHADSPAQVVREADYRLSGVGEMELFLEWLVKLADSRLVDCW